jgi:hypothetical protein
VVGCAYAECVCWSACCCYTCCRYVGEMSLLLPERRHVRLSVLDFWGNREVRSVCCWRYLMMSFLSFMVMCSAGRMCH